MGPPHTPKGSLKLPLIQAQREAILLAHGEGQVPALPLGIGFSLVLSLNPFLPLELLFGPALSIAL